MSNETVELLREEMATQVTDITSPLEGFRDLERALNKPEEATAKAAISTHITVLQKRLDLISVAETALKNLDEHGFDTIPDLVLPAEVYAIVAANNDSINAAIVRTKARPEPATGVDFTLGEEQPKT